ncbi:lactonase family protein [Paraburkholderia sp. HP33-1]|uniref:lactonase family protein n=1 Tax=Paraburkholderia sp. HP33-1 TaxID=2883243 RepID=UPI001F24FBDF|nr:lactonase family protein [Paraburkholderia sp. HP33-1]
MEKKKVFAYVGTWPALLRGSIPGFRATQQTDAVEKTGIFGFHVDLETGDWTPASTFFTSSMTSEICFSHDGRFLYANDEDRNRNGVLHAGGGILAFSINRENGELELLNEQSSMGTSPTYVDTDTTGRFAFLANLGNPHDKFVKVIRTRDGSFAMITEEEEGSLAMFSIRQDGTLTSAIELAGAGSINPESPRAGFSHYHCVKVDPSNRFVLACDTNDKIHVFKIDHKNGKLVPSECPFFETRARSGPRTLLFHPSRPWFFVNNQNNSTVYSFSFDSGNGAIEELDWASAVVNNEDAAKSWTSDMAISPDGNHLYVSNRSLRKLMPHAGCPPDTIAIFKIDQQTGKLTLKAVTPVEANHPRGVAFAPGGKFLYVAGMDANAVYRYTVDPDSGTLSDAAVVANMPVPSSVRFLTVD